MSDVLNQNLDRLTSPHLARRIRETTTPNIEFVDRMYQLERYGANCRISLIRTSDLSHIFSANEPEDNYLYGANRDIATTGPGKNGFLYKIVRPMVREFTQRMVQYFR